MSIARNLFSVNREGGGRVWIIGIFVVSSEEKRWKKEKSTEGVDIVIIMF